MQAIFLVITMAVLVANIAADVVFVLVDPRTRYRCGRVSVIPVTLNFDAGVVGKALGLVEVAENSCRTRDLRAFVIMAIVGPFLAPYDPVSHLDLFPVAALVRPPPGTTAQGQDVLSQLLVGARYSMLVGIVAAAIGESSLPSSSGSLPASWAASLMRCSRRSRTFSWSSGPPTTNRAFGLSGQLGLGGLRYNLAHSVAVESADPSLPDTSPSPNVTTFAAAKVAGDSNLGIVIFEILPNETAIIVTGFLFQVLFAMIVQTGLAFLGIGSLESWSWGGILYFAQNSDAFLANAWWWYAPPGLCPRWSGSASRLINLGIDEIINPKLRVEHERRKRAGSQRLVEETL